MHAPESGNEFDEIEAKVLEIDPTSAIANILAIGARPESERRTLENIFLVRKEDDKSVRLRIDGDKKILTHKGEISEAGAGVKKAKEYETFVSNPEATVEMFRALGFERVRTVTKMRTTFLLGPREHIEIDEYPGIPPLLEIEALSRERIVEIAASLGYAESQLSSFTIRDLERHYGVQFGHKG